MHYYITRNNVCQEGKRSEKVMKANSTIRDRARAKGVYLWEIAQAIGKSEPMHDAAADERSQIVAIPRRL